MSLYQHGMTLKSLLQDPNLINPPKIPAEKKAKKDDEDDFGFLMPGQGAFLGPSNLWDKTYDDFKLEYMDLDEFLHENGIPSQDGGKLSPDMSPRDSRMSPQHPRMSPQDVSRSPQHPRISPQDVSRSPQHHGRPGVLASPPRLPSDVLINPPPYSPVSGVNSKSPSASPSHSHTSSSPSSPKVDFAVSDADLSLAQVPAYWSDDYGSSHSMEQGNFDPTRRRFTAEELRPQPMIKKSRKVFVPDEMKDEKYWCRRKKNNVAAKRSRDARRIKENQIALRAAFLEQENTQLKTENQKLKAEMKEMKKRMAQLESVMPKEKPRDKNEVTASNLSVS